MQIVAEIQRRLGPSSKQNADARTTEEATQDKPRQGEVSPEKLAQLAQFVDGLKPPIAIAYSNLGAISAGGRDFAAAAKYFQKAAEWNASLPGLDQDLAMALFYSGQYADAMQPLGRILQAQPNDVRARSMLALSLYKTGDFHRVIETLQPLSSRISADPALASAFADSYYQTGKLQLEAGQTDAAISALETATKLSPQNPAFHNQLALAYRHAGRETEAQEEEKTYQTLTGGQPH
jgi:Flp pilus assembly protein TadD